MMTSGDEAEQTKSEQPDEDVKAQTGSAENSHAAGAEDQTDAVQAEAESASSDGEETSDSDSESGIDRDELKDQLLRVMADNENLRKRTEREVAAAKKYGALSFARDLLASLDNLEKAATLIPEDKEGMDETVKNILIGVEMTGRELASAFERHGIQRINPEGEKFDYNLHQAMFEVPTDDVEPGMVVQVVQPGYSLHDRLLRPAMVGVSKAATDTATPPAS